MLVEVYCLFEGELGSLHAVLGIRMGSKPYWSVCIYSYDFENRRTKLPAAFSGCCLEDQET